MSRLSSLRSRLLLLVCLSLLPALILVTVNGLEARNAAAEHARRDAQQMAYLIGRQEQYVIESTRSLLETIRLFRDTLLSSPEECSAFLSQTAQDNPVNPLRLHWS